MNLRCKGIHKYPCQSDNGEIPACLEYLDLAMDKILELR